MRKMAECEHCGGQKTCTQSGGRSCIDCLRAAGQGRRSHAAVRCSFCGGRGFVMVEVDEEEAEKEQAEEEQASEE
jgi:DNA-directed RNA polymerase subunit RPC12/RpoP